MFRFPKTFRAVAYGEMIDSDPELKEFGVKKFRRHKNQFPVSWDIEKVWTRSWKEYRRTQCRSFLTGKHACQLYLAHHHVVVSQ